MKEKIKEFVLGLGVDDVGFSALADYQSPRSPKLESIFPGIKSIIVLVHKELSTCESENMMIAMNGRLDLMEFSRASNYKIARYTEKEFSAKTMTIPVSYPMTMSYETMGSVGEVSLRHAAVAAGLGTLGRHNLVIHPKFGTRVVFTAILTDLEISSDPQVDESTCDQCGECVSSCPMGALDEEGKTNVNKCLRNSQPYGLGSQIKFWTKFVDSTPEEQKAAIKDIEFWRLYQAGFIGFQYFCFNCYKSCPAVR
ncbi:MAG: 4Fe-4S binding protein [Bacillota bacterium]